MIIEETVTEIANFFSQNAFAHETERTYENILFRLFSSCDPATLNSIDLVKFLRDQGWGNSRQCVGLHAIQKFLRWKYGSSHPALLARIKRTKAKIQPSLTYDQALKVLASFDRSTPKGARDLAMAALWLDTGLRCREMVALELSDLNLDYQIHAGTFDVHCGILQVPVKGGDWKGAVFSLQTAQFIRDWLSFDVERKRGVKTAFVSLRTHDRLTPAGLWKVVSEWEKQIDWGGNKVVLSPHVFRRAFADLATIYGSPTRITQLGGRWSDIQMVERYTQNLKLMQMIPYLPVTNMMR